MKIDYPLLLSLTCGLAFYASMRWRYWRKRALHTEECLAITHRIQQIQKHKLDNEEFIRAARKSTPC